MRPERALPSASGLSRRTFLAGLLAAAGSAACRNPVLQVSGESEAQFPADIPLYAEDYENWAGDVTAAQLPTFAPRSAEDIVRVANWAAGTGRRLRARGMRHGWAPLTITTGVAPDSGLVIADTTQRLNRAELVTHEGIPAVRAEAGVLMEDLLAFLEEGGFGFTATTAPGGVTVGGVLAIDGHGCAIPAAGEQPLPQQTYGSLSNRVLQLKAVVWDARAGAYALRSFDRRDKDIAALLVHLGRGFITEATLAVEPNQNLRCQSFVDIPWTELFAAPGSSGRTIESYLASAGRIESIWFPYTENPWLKVWSVSPQQPLGSRAVSEPYNYPFSDNIPDELVALAQEMVTTNPSRTPEFTQAVYAVSAAGLAGTASFDLWGPSKNTMQFIRPTTLRIHPCSFVVLTRRDRVQRVLHEYTQELQRRLEAHRAAGRYPMNMPIEYRVTGLDHAGDVGYAGAQPATLSAVHPVEGRPDWDTAVWLTLLTIPGTPDSFPFFREMERWLLDHFDRETALVRPEWSKGWAYTDEGAWTNPGVMAEIRERHRYGRTGGDDWDRAAATYRRLDPAGIFTNDLLSKLFD